MHNGYFYPQDIKIYYKEGKKIAEVNFDLPTLWTEDSLNLSKKCYLSGWEMARRAYENKVQDDWLKEVYPEAYLEKVLSKQLYSEGMSVSGFRTHLNNMKGE